MSSNFNSKSPNKYYTQNVGALNSYLNEISKHEILPEKEIRKLLKLAKLGDKNAVDKIVKAQSRFVFSLAKRYSSGEYELLLDLINEGNIGVIQAIEKFKNSFDNKFYTFSKYWVTKNIFTYLTYTNDTIRRPNKIKSTKIKKVSNRFVLENGRLPMASEIMDILEDEGYSVAYNKDDADYCLTFDYDMTSVTRTVAVPHYAPDQLQVTQGSFRLSNESAHYTEETKTSGSVMYVSEDRIFFNREIQIRFMFHVIPKKVRKCGTEQYPVVEQVMICELWLITYLNLPSNTLDIVHKDR